jgi:hypothetical protein
MMLSHDEKNAMLTRLEAMGLLDTTGRGSRFTSSLGGELLARGFATGRLG